MGHLLRTVGFTVGGAVGGVVFAAAAILAFQLPDSIHGPLMKAGPAIGAGLGFFSVQYDAVASWRERLAAKREAVRREAALALWNSKSSPANFSYSHGDESTSRNFPVTDGAYDPELYRRRGGYPTFSAMHDLGIDDYDTYRNNVEEAD